MKQYDLFQLQVVLNYDSNKEQVFTLVERNQIHRGISRKLEGHDHHFPAALQEKVTQVHLEIKNSGYEPVKIIYYMDMESMQIRIKRNHY